MDIAEGMMGNGVPRGLAFSVLAMFGAGVQVYGDVNNYATGIKAFKAANKLYNDKENDQARREKLLEYYPFLRKRGALSEIDKRMTNLGKLEQQRIANGQPITDIETQRATLRKRALDILYGLE